MFKRTLAYLAVSIAFIGALEEPAHSANSLEKAAMLAVLASSCSVTVPDRMFLPILADAAREMGVDVSTVTGLIRVQAQIIRENVEAKGLMNEVCTKGRAVINVEAF